MSRDLVLKTAADLGIDWSTASFTPDDLIRGYKVELEHGKISPDTNVTDDNPVLTTKIALAHLNEYRDGQPQSDYYDALDIVEDSPAGVWRGVSSKKLWYHINIAKWVVLVLILIFIVMFFRTDDTITRVVSFGSIVGGLYLINLGNIVTN